jgi:ACT domain-containing protein
VQLFVGLTPTVGIYYFISERYPLDLIFNPSLSIPVGIYSAAGSPFNYEPLNSAHFTYSASIGITVFIPWGEVSLIKKEGPEGRTFNASLASIESSHVQRRFSPLTAIITVVGVDMVGIIARVSALLADRGINILSISQTILEDYFTMMMRVDLAGTKGTFAELGVALEKAGADMGMKITLINEEVLKAMHRI